MEYNTEHFLLKQKAQDIMPDTHPNPSIEAHPDLQAPVIPPEEYLGTVLNLYRQDHADYRGRRNEDQQIIAEYASEEADEYFDQMVLATVALRGLFMPVSPSDVFVAPDAAAEADITLGNIADGVSMKDMRSSWRQLWVGMNVMTNRLNRDHPEFKEAHLHEIFEMPAEEKDALKNHLFGNFQDLNALRFGAHGSGVKRHKWKQNLDSMEFERIKVDIDKAPSDKALAGNAARRRYSTLASKDGRLNMHIAGKMTPAEFIALRKEFPEVDMDDFTRDTSAYKDVQARYRRAADE